MTSHLPPSSACAVLCLALLLLVVGRPLPASPPGQAMLALPTATPA